MDDKDWAISRALLADHPGLTDINGVVLADIPRESGITLDALVERMFFALRTPEWHVAHNAPALVAERAYRHAVRCRVAEMRRAV